MKMTQTALAEKMPLEQLVTEFGPLAKTVPLFKPGTIQHADQLTNSRRQDRGLRNTWFNTADSNVYTVEDGEAILYFGRGETNPVFKNLEEATRQLLQTGNYITSKDELEAVKSAESTLKVKLSESRLQGDDSEWRYFEVDTRNPDSLNKAERAFAERVYGQGDDFIQNMQMLRGTGKKPIIGKTRVYVLNPDYVKQNAPKDGGLARASRLDRFDVGSGFVAYDRVVGSHFGLRGVRNVAEGDAPRITNPFANAYQVLLENTGGAVREMNPSIAAGVSNILTQYLKQQKQ